MQAIAEVAAAIMLAYAGRVCLLCLKAKTCQNAKQKREHVHLLVDTHPNRDLATSKNAIPLRLF